MSLFGKIMSKLGLGDSHSDANASPTNTPSALGTAAGEGPGGSVSTPSTTPPADTTVAATPISQVDVASKLDGLAASHGEQLNWRTSIVDLLKVLGLDSSLTERQEMAKELGCPADTMNDSASMNMWLHKAVLQKLAQNGGKVPPELM
jgi:hypothetical protein